jgi:serine/threonine-protein kinase
VWRGQDIRLQRSVAVKILRSEFTADATFLSRFRAEALCAALLNHPHIAAVHDYGEAVAMDSGEPLAYLVMELVEGESLCEWLARSGRLDASQTLQVIGQTAAALGAAHAAGVVHRDVKPGNVLVTPDLNVKITDFGVAQSASSVPLTGTGKVIGTAHYLSPEQAAGGKASPASDVYALGVVAYECLAGRRPFEGEGSVQVALQQIRDLPPPLAPTVPADVRRLVEHAMAKDPAERFSDGAAFRDAIHRVTAQQSPVAADRQPTAVLQAPSFARPAVALAPTAGAPTAETRRLAVPSIDRGVRKNRGNAVLRRAAAIAILVVVAVVAAFISAGGGGASVLRQLVGAPTTSAAAPTSVRVRAADLVGRPLPEVQAHLTMLGLRMQPHQIVTGDVPAGQVIAVEPVGPVIPGQTLVVTYAVAPAVANQGTSNGHGNPGGDGEGD